MTDAIQRAVFGEAALAGQENLAREEEFAALVRAHSRFVFRVAYAALRNVEDAEDAAQEAFLKIYRAGAWRGVAHERAFLARVAWRAALDKRPRRRSEQLPEDMPDKQLSPEQALFATDAQAMLHRMIDALPEKLRQPLALSAIEELDSAAIAKILSMPESTVRGRIMQARGLLKRKFTEREKRNG
jgi:RNA polymerase sigma-70 factor (ECF subfamily)